MYLLSGDIVALKDCKIVPVPTFFDMNPDGVLDESRVCRLHCCKDGGGVELYSLEMLAALAFRIDTLIRSLSSSMVIALR